MFSTHCLCLWIHWEKCFFPAFVSCLKCVTRLRFIVKFWIAEMIASTETFEELLEFVTAGWMLKYWDREFSKRSCSGLNCLYCRLRISVNISDSLVIVDIKVSRHHCCVLRSKLVGDHQKINNTKEIFLFASSHLFISPSLYIYIYIYICELMCVLVCMCACACVYVCVFLALWRLNLWLFEFTMPLWHYCYSVINISFLIFFLHERAMPSRNVNVARYFYRCNIYLISGLSGDHKR